MEATGETVAAAGWARSTGAPSRQVPVQARQKRNIFFMADADKGEKSAFC
jgi:hypothetical protein